MTPTLDRYLHQWSIYKRCLIAFLAVNVFSVALAAVLAFNYFSFKRNLGHDQAASLNKIELADSALNNLAEFENDFEKRTKFEIRTREDEVKIMALLQSWQNFKSMLALFSDLELSSDMSIIVPTPESRIELRNLKAKLILAKQTEIASLKANLSQHNDTTKLMILTGLLTLIFGILLPHFVLFLMGRTLNHIRLEIQNAALDFIKAWSATKAGFGEEAFKNVDFWLQVLLLVGQQAGRMSAHPAVQVSSELAHIVRIELQKKSTDKTAA